MFHKPFYVQSQTTVKGSDRKKIRSTFKTQYPSLTEDQIQQIIPTKRNFTVSNLVLHNNQHVKLYSTDNPSFFELENAFFLTVYSLWNYPNLLNAFWTWPQVFPKLLNGADLMLPGIIKRDFSHHFQKGSICCIKLVGNNAPMAIGLTAVSADDINDSSMKGKAVNVIHCFQDFLWKQGDKIDPPLLEVTNESLDDISDSSSESTEVPALGDLCISEEADKSVMEAASTDTLAQKISDHETSTNINLVKQEMDALLFKCFMCAIKISVKKTDLPLLASNFFKNHMQKFCDEKSRIDIKKSSYTKLSKFLDAMSSGSSKLVDIKETAPGVLSITNIYKNHPDYQSFIIEDSMEQNTNLQTKKEKIQITNQYVLNSAVLTLFPKFRKGAVLTSQQLCESLQYYTHSQNLQNNVGEICIDSNISDALFNSKEYNKTISFDELVKKCSEKMGSAYQISIPGKNPEIRKGAIEPILIKVVQRSGNKKVTLITNLESYGIEPSEFAHEIQLGVACSTSVNPLPGKNKGMETLVQGNQIDFIEMLIKDKYGVSSEYISAPDKKVKKKGKNRFGLPTDF